MPNAIPGRPAGTLDENDFFRQATLRISSSLNIEVSMNRCLDFLKAYVPSTGMLFSLYDPDLNVSRILASVWPDDMDKPEDTISLPAEFVAWARQKMSDMEADEPSKITIINDVEREDPALRRVMAMFWPSDTSQLIMRLVLEKKRLGSLVLLASGKNRFTDFHAHLISLLHEPFAAAISNILQHREIQRLNALLADDNRYLHQEMLKMTGDTIIGAKFGLRDVMQMVGQVAPMDSPVLLIGETGVGKEVIANAIHYASQRQGGPYIKVNCGAIPETLIDSELFGHEKGAFTGAISTKRGHFERAHGGTIFLDEIGELPPAAQVRLLRVLQQHEIERVGGTESIPVDVRIISATHRNLEEMVRAGRFREDLWFRINVFPIVIPPLRQRTEDIPALVSHFMERNSRKLKIQQLPAMAPGAIDQLQSYSWPGNIRELENLVERALILNQRTARGPLSFDTLLSGAASAAHDGSGHPKAGFASLDEVAAVHIRKALRHCGGRIEGPSGAAALLKLHPSTLRARMRKLGITHGRASVKQKLKG